MPTLPQEEIYFSEKYLQAKIEAHNKIKEAIYAHEDNFTKEIRNDMNRNKFWDNIYK